MINNSADFKKIRNLIQDMDIVKKRQDLSNNVGKIPYLQSYIKKHFGIEVSELGFSAIQYLYELDKKKYLENTYLNRAELEEAFLQIKEGKKVTLDLKVVPVNKLFLKIGTKYFVKVDAFTYIFVSTGISSTGGSIINLYFFGKHAPREFRKLFKILSENYKTGKSLYVKVYEKGSFKIKKRIQELTDHLFIIPQSTSDKIYNYLDKSLKLSKDLFNKHGLIKNPGIILYGEPGTGKSSIINSFALRYNAEIIYFQASHIVNCIEEYTEGTVPTRYPNNPTIIVFEDIDILCKTRDDVETCEDKENFNTLLQFLDGPLQVPGIIKVATTNRIEALDKALIRQGRFDLQIEMTGLCEEDAKKMCDNFNVSYDVLKEEEFPINPAYLQSKIIQNL